MKDTPESYFKNLLLETEYKERFRQEIEKLNRQYKEHDIAMRYEIRESKQEHATISNHKRKEHFLLIEIEQAQIEIPMEIHNECANTYTTAEYRAYLEQAYNAHELGANTLQYFRNERPKAKKLADEAEREARNAKIFVDYLTVKYRPETLTKTNKESMSR